MKTFITALKVWCRHNQAIVISIVLMLIMAGWFTGCESKTQSLINPAQKVTEDELNIEYTSQLAKLESDLKVLKATTEVRLQDLQKQDAFKQALYKNAQLIVDGNNPNPLGLLSLLGTLFGIGAVIDNRKKDGLIKGLQTAKNSVVANADNSKT